MRREVARALQEVERTNGPVGGAMRTMMRDLMAAFRNERPDVEVETPVEPSAPTGGSKEEVKLILSMVAEGKISPEDAEKLLRAIE